MRPVLAGDVFAVARVLQNLRQVERVSYCRRLFQQAEWADKYRKRMGRLHPSWGNGSLMGRIGMEGAPSGAPQFQDADFCANVALVLHELNRWRSQKSEALS